MNSDEYSGETYSCAHWPKEWGLNKVSDWFKSPDLYEKHLGYLSLWLQGLFFLKIFVLSLIIVWMTFGAEVSDIRSIILLFLVYFSSCLNFQVSTTQLLFTQWPLAISLVLLH